MFGLGTAKFGRSLSVQNPKQQPAIVRLVQPAFGQDHTADGITNARRR
jgi:hypothetical protein